jgi:UDP-glucose 4-epimerase
MRVASSRPRVVVTGASGFIGRALVRALSPGDADVIGVARRPGFGHVVSAYEDAPEGDVLVHLAETADRGRILAAVPAAEAEAVHALAMLMRKSWKAVVYVSSAALYSDDSETPRTPHDPVRATDPYTRIKLLCEREVLGKGGTVARLANVYGRGMHEGSVLAGILRQLPQPGPVKLRSKAPVRDFLFINDAATGLAAMALEPTPGIYNLGTGVGTSVGRLAQLVLECAGTPGREVIETVGTSQHSALVLDCADTSAVFHWAPEVSLPDGIRRIVGND